MADKEITGLVAGGAVGDNDLFLSRQSTTSEDKKVTGVQLKTYVSKGFGVDTVDLGATAASLGVNSISIGKDASTQEDGCIAIGFGAVAGVAPGTGVDEDDAIAIGTNARALERHSIAIGHDANNMGLNSVLLGDDCIVSGTKSVVVGNSSQATGEFTISIGDVAVAAADYSISIGTGSNVQSGAGNSIAIGYSNLVTSNHQDVTLIGYDLTSRADDSVDFGNRTILLGQFATGNLPGATNVEGGIVYDSTTSTIKFSDGSSWQNISSGGEGGGISNIVEDTSPQLGGDLGLNGNVITGLEIGTDVQAYSAVLAATTASFTTADETKLDGIATSATANDTDADLKNRADHTGSQAMSTISDAGALATLDDVSVSDIDATGTANSSTFLRGDGAWAAPAGGGGGDLLAANNLSDLDNAGTARTNLGLAIGSDVQAYSAVLAATTASFTSADETKLDGIETSATANTGALADLDTVDTAQIDNDAVTAAKLADTYVETDPAGVTGADAVTNMMSLTQAEYNAITPNSSTFYIITDAS